MQSPLTQRDDSLLSFVPDEIVVRVEPMLRIQGYRDLTKIRSRIRKIATEMALEAAELFEPVAQYRHCRIEGSVNGHLQLQGGVALNCPAFEKFLPGSREVVAFVLTIGSPFDERLDELQQSDKLVEALFLDAAGWLGVEALSKQFANMLRHSATRSGSKLTRRLSPGYSFKVAGEMVEWSLYEQTRLFELFGDTRLPVTLLESCAMLPRMSRSGLYGLKSG